MRFVIAVLGVWACCYLAAEAGVPGPVAWAFAVIAAVAIASRSHASD